MTNQIKQIADDALAMQNKVAMETALRQISELCELGHITVDTCVETVKDVTPPEVTVNAIMGKLTQSKKVTK